MASPQYRKMIERACQEPTLVKALSTLAIWHTDLVWQSQRNNPEKQNYETTYEFLFQEFMSEWARTASLSQRGTDQPTSLIIDCEHDSYCGELISIAMVEVEGLRSIYRALIPAIGRVKTQWVHDNVIPKVVFPDHPVVFEDNIFDLRKSIAHFLSSYSAVHIIADWPTDIQYFLDLVVTGPGTRIDTPPLTFEVRRDLDIPADTPGIHNALVDALAIKKVYLEKFTTPPIDPK